jgi:site-specific DNA recombinase
VVGPSGKKCIEPDPEVAPFVVQLYGWYGTGRHSLLEVTKMVRKAGMAYRKSGDSVAKSLVHKILRNRIYMGDFDWDRKTYQGTHKPLVSRDLWARVQAILDGRAGGSRKVKHGFAFSGIIRCGHCGCALVGEIKKNLYVYYHCTGYRGKCPERYTREEVLSERFASLLKGLSLDAEVLEWVKTALHQSHQDEKRFHDEAVARLQAEYARLQNRIDAVYLDKLDGLVDATFFERKAEEWCGEQDRLLRLVEEHQNANQNYLADGV